MQQQAMENAQDFYGQSLGRIKSQAQGYREQLEQYAQQLPEGNEQAQKRLEEIRQHFKDPETKKPEGGTLGADLMERFRRYLKGDGAL